jgi:hypothetical protein
VRMTKYHQTTARSASPASFRVVAMRVPAVERFMLSVAGGDGAVTSARCEGHVRTLVPWTSMRTWLAPSAAEDDDP